MITELVRRNRSYRRFAQGEPVGMDTLTGLVELARLSPSAGNLQPIRYVLSADEKTNAIVFPHLKWAGYLKDWPGPAEGERPAAYIIVMTDKEISKEVDCDHGIAAQSILLGAVEAGLGGCILTNIDRAGLARDLSIPERYGILLVIALGRPVEEVVVEPLKGNDVKYWRDAEGTHHVPKRALDEIIVQAGAKR